MDHGGIRMRTRTLVASLVTAAIVGAGARGLLTGPPAPSPTSRTTEAVPPPRSRPGPHDAAGAVRAATTYVRAGQQIFELPAAERDAALRELAATTAADGYVAQQQQHLEELDGIATRGQGPLTWHVAVLATRVDAITAHRARIEVWRLGVLSIGGLTAPIAEFTTVTYELIWERGTWRIWSETQTPGPSPMAHPEATPSTPQEWRARLEGFVRYPGREPL